MNYDNIDSLKEDEIFSLYNEIIDSPDLIGPHWCCGTGIDWDFFPSQSRCYLNASASYYCDSWSYTRYMCRTSCSGRDCTWRAYYGCNE